MWLLSESVKCSASVFSVKKERAPCQRWPLESVVTGFRRSWRTCDPLSPPMSPGNTHWGLTLTTGRYNSCFFVLFIWIPISSSPSVSFFFFLFNLYFQPAFQEKHPSETIGSEAQVGVLVCKISPPPPQCWCSCSAMSAPPFLSSNHVSCDYWVMSPS